MVSAWNSCIHIQAVITLSDTPQSRNVSVNTSVEFTCATPETGLAISSDVTLAWKHHELMM